MNLFMVQYFDKALDWINKSVAKSLPMARINMIKNALYFVEESNTKEEYAIGLIRSIGSMLTGNELNRFCNHVTIFNQTIL